MRDLGKTLLRTLLIVGGGLLALLLAAILLLWVLFRPSRDEVSRVPSPSGKYVASLIEVNGGATTSFGYEVRVARTGFNLGGTEVANLYAATRNVSAYGANLRWASDKELRIEYLMADSAHTVAPTFLTLAPSISVVLKPGVMDLSAPAGGMLYNIQGRP